ncbi:ABC transporter ATP-binding protein [Candidatus Avoscillospira sp. LCP25S3_F1]|uniref:ABC transporter ATP-binding protein n=1 Tax=Candidatus Avoscillospira sp. LCP25S3_F1 TaxID=3438825 RepID=UPI003F901EB9
MSEKEILLDVRDLCTVFQVGKRKTVTAVNGISFQVGAGEIVGLVGESGCGKSVTSLSVMQLLKNTSGRVVGGQILLKGKDLLHCSEKEMRSVRGKEISMIFQEPMSSLNPSMRIEAQMVEAIRLHTDMDKKAARNHALTMMRKVGIANPETTIRSYPHQLSGGMSQRVMIAMAMSCDPTVLIADEPTTALDVTIQAQILQLMRQIRDDNNTGILLITHDLGVVAEMCSRVIVMYAGRIVEEAPVQELFASPKHPYTQGLIASVPKLGSGVTSLPSIPGSVPDLSMMPEGCKFAPRCSKACDRCHQTEPPLFPLKDGRESRCWLAEPEAVQLTEEKEEQIG